MTLQPAPKDSTNDQLREAINWQATFPDYVFSEAGIRGFFIIGSGIFATRSFLDFMLGENLELHGTPLSVLVRMHEQPVRDLFFSTSSTDEIKDLRLHLMQGPLDLFGAIVVASGAPSKWVAYEEINEGFAVLAVFDDSILERWSSRESGIWDYVVSEQQIFEKLQADEWPGWDPDFLKRILESYKRRQEQQ